MRLSLMTLLLLVLTSCATRLDEPAGENLPGCPIFPGCASDTWMPTQDIDSAWSALTVYLQSQPNITVTVATPDYLRAEARTPTMGFVDDIEFRLLSDKSQIQARSASRLGISDLGANRQRLEQIKLAISKVTSL